MFPWFLLKHPIHISYHICVTGSSVFDRSHASLLTLVVPAYFNLPRSSSLINSICLTDNDCAFHPCATVFSNFGKWCLSPLPWSDLLSHPRLLFCRPTSMWSIIKKLTPSFQSSRCQLEWLPKCAMVLKSAWMSIESAFRITLSVDMHLVVKMMLHFDIFVRGLARGREHSVSMIIKSVMFGDDPDCFDMSTLCLSYHHFTWSELHTWDFLRVY